MGRMTTHKRTLLFAPAAFNLAETTRMIEIAKGIVHHGAASKVLVSRFSFQMAGNFSG